jgi:hypothetical protein
VSDLPDDLRDLDRRLAAVRFEPPVSLGAELAGRARRGEPPRDAAPRRTRRLVMATALLAAGLAAVAFGLPALGQRPEVTVDRCCYDLDGGGAADDGVRIVARRDADVRHLTVYEDADGSGGLTPADVVRFDRGGQPALAEAGVQGLTTLERCCLDFDGGGRADDGLLVLGVPPDRVVMAAIFEHVATRRLPLR